VPRSTCQSTVADPGTGRGSSGGAEANPQVFGQWKAPANFKIEFFVVRVGEWGGHMLVDCDDPLTIHKFCSMLPAFIFPVHPVIRVEDAVRGELEVIAWRDGLKGQ
jgi:hypothetical protein